jgi:hypothetical protein
MPDLVVAPERACFGEGSKALLLYLCPGLRYAHKLCPLFRVGIGTGFVRPGTLILPLACTLLQHDLLCA